MQNARLDKSQTGIKTVRRNTTLMAESKEEPKRVKEESGKAGLKLKIQKTKIVACGPITS